MIVVTTAVLTIAALGYSLSESARYQASAQVLISDQNLSAQLTGAQVADSTANNLATQAALARVPAVAKLAIKALHVSMSPAAFLDSTFASASSTSNLLTFGAMGSDSDLAARMATAYAHAYVRYRFASETAPIQAAKAGLEKRIAATPPGSLRNTLIENEQRLEEMTALRTSDARVVRDAEGASQIGPQTQRNTVLGLVLGILLGVGLAFLREALDTRVRSAETIGEQLELPLLARLPEPPRRLRMDNRLAMLSEPSGVQAEAFRMLRTNLEFAALGKAIRTVMVTSAIEREGKSTTIANLGVALARSGRRIVLVDLDLRRPSLDRFFDLREHAGLTQVAIGHVEVAEALAQVSLSSAAARVSELTTVVTNNGHVRITPNGGGRIPQGSLHVLVSGPIPPDPGEFVGTARLTEILEDLGGRADLVLIDAPPLFHAGDALVLSAKVDAVVAVTRLDAVRRPMVVELHRLLDMMPAAKLGFIVTGAEAEDGYGGYSYRPYEQQGAARVDV